MKTSINIHLWKPSKTIVYNRETQLGKIAKKSRVGRFCTSFKCTICNKYSLFGLEWSPKSVPIDHHFDTFTGDGVMMTVDHIVPKSWGGSFTSDNLRPMCRKCNSKRGNKVLLIELYSLSNIVKCISEPSLFLTKVKEVYPSEYDVFKNRLT
jgi:5-methylcytosine-specific restriction endonuclease McrA